MQFPVNDICNASCQMCHIWQQKLDYQISPSELETALNNSLYSEVHTVGVNGGEPTLRKDLAELVDVLFRTLPKLRTISLITNALVHRKVISRISEVGTVVMSHHGRLNVMVSLDGVGQVHDIVRGRKGNFDNALKVIDFIKTSELVTEIRLGCTVVKDNVFGLHDLMDFAIKKGIYIKYRLGIPHQRLYTEHLIDPFALSYEEKVHLCIFLENVIRNYETSENQKFFYRSLIDQIIYGSRRKAGCAWQHRGVTITARGELLYCAVKSKVLGSAVREDSQKLYFSNRDHLNHIISKECANCTHDYVGLPPGRIFLKHIFMDVLSRLQCHPSHLKFNSLPQPLRQLAQRWSFTARARQLGANLNPGIQKTQIIRTFPTHNAGFHVLVCGWYGTETLGDKAILAGLVSTLRSIFSNVAFSLASLEPYISKLTVRQMPELSDIEVIGTHETLARIDSMDMVVFGGGPIMAVKNLVDILAIFEKASTHAIPTVLAGCGVGPLGTTYQNRMIKQLLQLASLRIYRDRTSFNNASKLGIDTSNDFVADDPALTWIADKQRHAPVYGTRDNNGVTRLVLGLRDWPFNQYAPDLAYNKAKTIKDRFEEQVLIALLELTRSISDIKIIPFPMCTNHFGGDDRWFYRRLFRKEPLLHDAIDYSYLSREFSPNEAYDVFCSADAALTMRFHSLVFAVGMNIPVVACDYTLGSGKVTAFAEASGVPCRSLDNINAEFITHAVRSAIGRGKLHDSANISYAPSFPQALDSALSRLR